MMKDKNFQFGSIFSSLFCIWSICILNYSWLPSGDEIGTADSVINWLTRGEWYSAVWVYTYHPLHNFLLAIWSFVFGQSHVAISSLNVVIAFATSVLGLKILIGRGMVTNIWMTAAFVLLFWAFAPHSNGRIDSLMMFASIGMADLLIPSSTGANKSHKALAFYSFLLMMTGIYSLPVLLILGLCLLSYFGKDEVKRKELLAQAKVIVIWSFIAFVIVCLFYLYNHRLLRFLQTYIRFNSNFNKGMDNLQVHYTFPQMVAWGYKNYVVIAMCVMGMVIGCIKKNWNLALLSLFVFLVPVIASGSGHYMSYYFWMMEVSAIFILIWAYSLFEKKYVEVPLAVVAVIIYVIPQYKIFSSEHTNKEEMEDVSAYLEQNKQYLADSVYVHFEAQQAAEFYYPLREYPVYISGKVRLLENYTDPKLVFQKTLYGKFQDEKMRECGMKVFDMIEAYTEPNLDKGIVILKGQEKCDKLATVLAEKEIPFETLSTYKEFTMIRFGEFDK